MISLLGVLKIAASLLTVATGVLGFVRPQVVYGFTGLSADGPRGLSEIRAIFGGLFIGLGISPLFLGTTGFSMLGAGYLSIAAARFFSILFDRSFDRSNLISLVIEAVLGGLLVL